MHNLVFLDMNMWDPSYQLGDVKLIALASWMNHKENKEEEIKRILTKEVEQVLWMKT